MYVAMKTWNMTIHKQVHARGFNIENNITNNDIVSTSQKVNYAWSYRSAIRYCFNL